MTHLSEEQAAVLETVRRIGSGYMTDHPVERMMRDAKLTPIYTGTNQITRLVTGRALLRT